MPIKKSELHNALWKSCDELRGGMDASQYKDYMAKMIFIQGAKLLLVIFLYNTNGSK